MTRFVICPDVALRLAGKRGVPEATHQLFAPTLLRSQVLARLYETVRRGELTEDEAPRRLDHVRRLRVRLLGDRVLQDRAWTIAKQLDWPDTIKAEYVALVQLQADALVTLDAQLAREARALVKMSPVSALLANE